MTADLVQGAARTRPGRRRDPDGAGSSGPGPPPPARRPWRWAAAGLLGVLLLLCAAAATLRIAARTDAGRVVALRLLDGLPLGPVGRLRLTGLQGDLLGRLHIGRLAIVDARGAWLDASDVALDWRPADLLERCFHARRIEVGALRILRRPILAPQPRRNSGRAPVSLALDRVQVRLETLPAFSVRRGVFDVTARLRLARNGAASGQVDAHSRLHDGDGLTALFQVGEGRQVLLRADAVEARGGALAGVLGLPADQRLAVHGRADGSADAGALTLAARSGAATPLSLQAAWSRAGATVEGQVAFTASRLTALFTRGAGPDARLALAARRRADGLYDLKGALTARDASVGIDGALDWARRRTPGLDLRVQVADLSRWLPGVAIGATTTAGRLAGSVDQFTYTGAVQGERLSQSGYSLALARGPVTYSRAPDGWRVQADLAGSGGAGQGLAPALLGPAPHVRLDLDGLGGRRVLIRQLAVQGAGLKLDATGGRGLLGGLSFKGQATLSNLAAAHPGAHGSASATWAASRGEGTRAWTLELDARAQAFATGVAQVDRLIGAAPTLKASGTFGPDGLGLARADLAGSALQAGLSGRLSPQRIMDLAVDWSARGPFDAGPVEIAGQVKGTGRLTGDLAAPHADLDAELASLGLGALRIAPAHLALTLAKDGAGAAGEATLTGASRYGPASAKMAFRLDGADVDLSRIDLDAGGVRASGAMSLRSGAPSTADLTLAARAGAFLSAGQVGGRLALSQRSGALVVALSLDGREVALPGVPIIHALHLAADGPWARLPFQISAEAAGASPWRFAGEGLAAQTGAARVVTLSGQGRVRSADLKTLQPAVLRLDGSTRELTAQLALGGGRADVQARQQGQSVSARAAVSGVALATFDRDLVGSVNGTATLSGQGGVLGGALDATLAGARSRDAPADLALDARVKADLAGARLHLAASATNLQGLRSGLDLTLPAEAAAQPFHFALDRTRPIQGAFTADGELRPLWDLLVGGEQTLSGHVAARGVLGGTLAELRATGSAALTAGRFQDASSGLVLQALALDADFGQDAVRISRASGSDGHGGLMSGSGTVSLQRGGGSTFALKLAKFRLFDNDLGRATVSGDLTVDRSTTGQAKLSGALKVDRADISANTPAPTGVVALDVVEINRTPRPGEADQPAARAGAAPAAPVALDVAIRAPRGVFVRGKGLNVELSLDAHVTGTATAPDLTGVANLVLGSYDFAGKRFDFDQRGVIHLASNPADIRLDLSATLQEPSLTAVVRVAGTALKPDITLSSTPVLPQDEVLSQVLFGASASQLSPAQAAELASALASLSRGGGFDLLGRLRQFAGLDRLALGAGNSGTGVAGGKYINDNVYVELIGGGREGPQAAVEWRVRKNFSIVSQVGAQGDAQLSIQFRKNY